MKKKSVGLFTFLISTVQISPAQICATKDCLRNAVKDEVYCYTCGNALPAQERKNCYAAGEYRVREKLDNISETMKKYLQDYPVLLTLPTPNHVFTHEYIDSEPAKDPPLLNFQLTRRGSNSRARSVRNERLVFRGHQTVAPVKSQPPDEKNVTTSVDKQESLNALNQSLSLYQGGVKVLHAFPDYGNNPAKKWAVMVFWILDSENPEFLMVNDGVINHQVMINMSGNPEAGMESPEALISYWQQNGGSQGTDMLLPEFTDFSQFSNETFSFVIYMEDHPDKLIAGHNEDQTLWFLSPESGLISISLGEGDLLNAIINHQFRKLLAKLLGLSFESHVLRLLKQPDNK